MLWRQWEWWWVSTGGTDQSSFLYRWEPDISTNRYELWLLSICRFNICYFDSSWAIKRSVKCSNLSFGWGVNYLLLNRKRFLSSGKIIWASPSRWGWCLGGIFPVPMVSIHIGLFSLLMQQTCNMVSAMVCVPKKECLVAPSFFQKGKKYAEIIIIQLALGSHERRVLRSLWTLKLTSIVMQKWTNCSLVS